MDGKFPRDSLSVDVKLEVTDENKINIKEEVLENPGCRSSASVDSRRKFFVCLTKKIFCSGKSLRWVTKNGVYLLNFFFRSC